MKHRLIAAALLLTTGFAHAARIGDVTRLGNNRTNAIVGYGLVVGLPGTGDGGNYMPAITRLSALLSKFDNTVTPITDLAASKNVAIVLLSATVPPTGGKRGEALDVYVTSYGAAKSLRGGRLYVTPMQVALPGKQAALAFANGAISIEDPATPTTGVVKKGVVLETDLPVSSVTDGQFSLILDEPSASWTMSSNIAKIVNDSEDGQTWAVAVSEKEIVVRIPPAEQERPDGFISRVQRLPLPLIASEARVQINERTGTLILTGDVEISPVVIVHKGLTISTVTPKPVPSPRTPVVETRELAALDTANAGGAKLQDLITALDQLKVPVADRIEIVKELHKTGKLHAKLILE